jgi:hypothetical protein
MFNRTSLTCCESGHKGRASAFLCKSISAASNLQHLSEDNDSCDKPPHASDPSIAAQLWESRRVLQQHKLGDAATHPAPSANVQTKLKARAPEDIYEKEADGIAEQVMRMSEPQLQSGCSCGGCAAPRIQRLAGESTGQPSTAPKSVDRVLSSAGRPLDPILQQDMEQPFGYNFSGVRVHCGAAAEQSALEVNAHAYTVGTDIVFGAGRFAPATHEGRRLIAHELTHVVQQSRAGGIQAGPFRALQRQPENCPPGRIEEPEKTRRTQRIAKVFWVAGSENNFQA